MTITPKIMCYNILVADSVEQGKDFLFTLEEGLPETIIPRVMFRGTKNTATLSDVKEWVKYRIPPKNRQDIKEMLKDFGLKKYDPVQFALKTGASVIGDGWWIKTSEEQTYQNHTLKGSMGHHEDVLADYLLTK